MAKNNEKDKKQYHYTQNRELSWLKFNQRVLEEATDQAHPPLERLNFVSIFGSNLDEFFMVRVGSLYDISLISPNDKDNKSGMTAAEQLTEIYNTIPGLIELKRHIYTRAMDDLKTYGIQDVSYAELTASEQKFLNQYYKTNLLPILSAIIVGSHHPVPHLVNKHLYIAALLKNKKGKYAVGIIPMPESAPEYVALPESNFRYIRTENILLNWAPTLFGKYEVAESCIISVTRNADISFDEEKFEDSEKDFRKRVKKLLKKRDNLAVVRLEISGSISNNFKDILAKMVQVEKYQISNDLCPLNMGYVGKLKKEPAIVAKAEELIFKPYKSRWPEDISQDYGIIEQIKQHDKLLFYPFDSVEPFLHLLSEAAENSEVVSIKITIYRLASSSKIAHILCKAAENGKEVIVLMELRARFDEANNVAWASLLEEAGCQVIYGVEGYKCHSKMCLITMKNKDGLNYITQVSTGNYNEKTNTMYTDLTLMTASHAIGEDATLFFQNMLISNIEGEYNELLLSPNGIKNGLCRLIDEEIKKGAEGYICIKANAITEREVIDKLCEASKAQVEIHLIIRGICCLLPNVPGYTENIHIHSIIGRFLEHARVYCFGKGDERKMYISSADLMTRNLNRRIEIACPIYDAEIKTELEQVLSAQLKDNVKSAIMLADGSYCKTCIAAEEPFDSQKYFMEHSLHHMSEYKPLPQKMSLWQKIKHIFA